MEFLSLGECGEEVELAVLGSGEEGSAAPGQRAAWPARFLSLWGWNVGVDCDWVWAVKRSLTGLAGR